MFGPKRNEKKLTEPSHDELRDGELTAEDYFEHRGGGEDFVKQLRESGRSIRSGLKAVIEVDLARQIDIEIIKDFSEPADDPNLLGDDPEPNSEMAELMGEMRALLAENQNAPQEQTWSTATRGAFALFVITALAGAGALVYYIIKRNAKGQGDADITQVPEDVKAQIRQLVALQRALPDDVFWNHMAEYIDNGIFVNGNKVTLTLSDQLVFLNFVIASSPLNTVWDWGPSVNAYKNAETLKGYYESGKKMSDIYRRVLEAKFEGKSMPRATAAKQIQTALTWIYRELK